MAKPKNTNRRLAELLGANFYEGPPCRRGHTRKYVKTAHCVVCSLDRAKASTAADPKARIAYRKEWYRRNSERCKAKSAAWREANPERFRETLRNWVRSNPEKAKANYRLQRSRRRGAFGHHTLSHVRAILRAQDGYCAYCDASTDLHLDHICPIARGGSNWPWNLQWLCAFHNMSKNARTDSEYRALIGLLILEPVSVTMWRHIFFILDLPFPEPF